MRRVRVNPAVEYFEVPPPRVLARHIQCAWRLRSGVLSGPAQAIYPDGRCELIVHLGEPPRCWDAANGWLQQSPILFASQRVSAVRLSSRAPVDCIGVRLRPAASALIARGLLPRLRETISDLTLIDAGFARRFATAARASARSDFAPLWRLMTQACRSGPPVDGRIEAAVERIGASLGRVRIDALARTAHMSMRGFQSHFRRDVGLPPKEFARLTRLQSLLRALDSDSSRIADIAADAGFSDQPHATREVRRVTGSTPARLQSALQLDRDSDAAVSLAAAFVRGRSR